jgi:hypothetical protein
MSSRESSLFGARSLIFVQPGGERRIVEPAG